MNSLFCSSSDALLHKEELSMFNVIALYLLYHRFNVVGYGCMTCIGNSGPLSEPVSEAIEKVNKMEFSMKYV